MRLITSLIVTVATTTTLIHTISALPTTSNPNGLESYSLSNASPALNTSFLANVTDLNGVFVEECGDKTSDIEHAHNLARAAVMVAKADAVRGAHSPFGFNAMFKNDNSKYLVSIYLNMIYYSDGLMRLKPNMSHLTPPRLACVQPNSAIVYRDLRLGYDPWERCNRRRPGQSTYGAFYAYQTAYIFLCPGFHDLAAAPLGSHCPSVVDNRFVGDADTFYRKYQMYTLLYELIRFYFQKSALGSKSRPKEVFDWNQCVGYDTSFSLRNPTNLLLYTALAQQTCFAAPNPFEPPFLLPTSTIPPAINMLQTSMSDVPNAAASAQVASASVDPSVSLMVPLPYSETS